MAQVLVGFDGGRVAVKLVDFGLSRNQPSDANLTLSVVGTPLFSPPEVLTFQLAQDSYAIFDRRASELVDCVLLPNGPARAHGYPDCPR